MLQQTFAFRTLVETIATTLRQYSWLPWTLQTCISKTVVRILFPWTVNSFPLHGHITVNENTVQMNCAKIECFFAAELGLENIQSLAEGNITT